MQPERIIQNSIIKYLHLKGIFCWNVRNGATYNKNLNGGKGGYQARSSMKGISDIIGIHPDDGRLIALEVKTAKGRPTPEQKDFIYHINRSGGIAGIVRSVEDVIKLLDSDNAGHDDSID